MAFGFSSRVPLQTRRRVIATHRPRTLQWGRHDEMQYIGNQGHETSIHHLAATGDPARRVRGKRVSTGGPISRLAVQFVRPLANHLAHVLEQSAPFSSRVVNPLATPSSRGFALLLTAFRLPTTETAYGKNLKPERLPSSVALRRSFITTAADRRIRFGVRLADNRWAGVLPPQSPDQAHERPPSRWIVINPMPAPD